MCGVRSTRWTQLENVDEKLRSWIRRPYFFLLLKKERKVKQTKGQVVFLWWITCIVIHVVLWFPGFWIKILFAVSEHKRRGQLSVRALCRCSLGQQQLELHSWEEPVSGEICSEGIVCWSWRLKEKLWVHANTACGELPKGICLAAVPPQGSATALRALHPRAGHLDIWGMGALLWELCSSARGVGPVLGCNEELQAAF